jgi:hypothetical protein
LRPMIAVLTMGKRRAGMVSRKGIMVELLQNYALAQRKLVPFNTSQYTTRGKNSNFQTE